MNPKLTRRQRSLLLEAAKEATYSGAKGRLTRRRCDRLAADVVRDLVGKAVAHPFATTLALLLVAVAHAVAGIAA